MNQLQKLETWRADLAKAETIEEIKMHSDAASALAQLAKRQKISFDKQNEIGEFRIDVETKKGEWLDEHFKSGKHDNRGNQHAKKVEGSNKVDPSKMPVSKSESAKARKIKNTGKEDPDILDAIKDKIKASGDVITPEKVYKEIKKQEKKIEIQKQKEDIKNIREISDIYDLIVIDPPWPYGRKYDPDASRVANPYPEMSIEEIKNIILPIKDDGILFLWTTHQILPHSFDILKKWGFDYKATMVWNKEKIGMGYWLRMQCEFCLLAIKGKPIWDIKDWRDIFSESRREHSRKPDSFFQSIDKYFNYTKRLEYFSREQREEWDVFGNDINKF